MAVKILWGPPFSAKSQILDRIAKPEEAVIDATRIWRATFPNTKQKVRSRDVALFVQETRMAAVRAAVKHDIDAWVPISTADRAVVKLWQADARQDEVVVVKPPRQNAMAAAMRRGRRDGTTECEDMVARWYDSHVPDPADIPFDLAAYGIPAGSPLGRYLTVGGAKPMKETRSTLTRMLVRDAALEVREARQEGGRPVLAGVVLRYGDKSRMGWRAEEVFEPGSIQWDAEKPMNLTRQHNRGAPIGLVRLQDGPNELRFSADISDTQAGRDTITEVQDGLMRGASLEFHAVRDEWQAQPNDGELRIIKKAVMTGLSVVDDGAYSSGTVEARAAADLEAAIARARGERAARRAAATLRALEVLEGGEGGAA